MHKQITQIEVEQNSEAFKTKLVLFSPCRFFFNISYSSRKFVFYIMLRNFAIILLKIKLPINPRGWMRYRTSCAMLQC